MIPTLYHGTRKPFSKGGLVMPRTFHGSTGTTAPLKPGASPRPDSERFVYVTPSLMLAWVYAWSATGRGRPRVLTVKPLSDVWADPEHSADMEAYRCEAALVEAVDLVPLVDEQTAVAGWVDA